MPTPPPLPNRRPSPPPLPTGRNLASTSGRPATPPPLPGTHGKSLPLPAASDSSHLISDGHLAALKSLNEQHGGALNGRHDSKTGMLHIYHPDNPAESLAQYPVLPHGTVGAKRISVAAPVPPPLPVPKKTWFSRLQEFSANPAVQFEEWKPPKATPQPKPVSNSYVSELDPKARRQAVMDFYANPSVQDLVNHHKVNEPGIGKKEAQTRLHHAYEAYHAAARQPAQAPMKPATSYEEEQAKKPFVPFTQGKVWGRLGKPESQRLAQPKPSPEQMQASNLESMLANGVPDGFSMDKASEIGALLRKFGKHDAAQKLESYHENWKQKQAEAKKSAAAPVMQQAAPQQLVYPQKIVEANRQKKAAAAVQAQAATPPVAPPQSAPMPEFHYKALDNSGQLVSGKVNAANKQHAEKLIQANGHFSPEFVSAPKPKKAGFLSGIESKLGGFFDKFESKGNKFLRKVGIPAPTDEERRQQFSRDESVMVLLAEFARKSAKNQLALDFEVNGKQKRFDWDESKVTRESIAHDGKRPGEFAKKENTTSTAVDSRVDSADTTPVASGVDASPKQESGERKMAVAELPKLEGSEKQVAWASNIREVAIPHLGKIADALRGKSGEVQEFVNQYYGEPRKLPVNADDVADAAESIAMNTSSKWWIDNAKNIKPGNVYSAGSLMRLALVAAMDAALPMLDAKDPGRHDRREDREIGMNDIAPKLERILFSAYQDK